MSDFDDLMNLGESTPQTGGGGGDPFDPYSGGTSVGGNLLDFDGLGSLDGSSGAKSFAANTNPLYEFTNSSSKMSANTDDQLLDFMGEAPAPQKDVKQEPSNPLYDFMNNETNIEQTNGYDGDLLNGGNEYESGNVHEEVNDNNNLDFLDTRNSEMMETRNTEMFETRNTEFMDTRNTEIEEAEEEAQDEEDAEIVADESGPFTSDDSGVTVDLKEVEEQQRATTPEPEDDEDHVGSKVEEVVVEKKEEFEVAAIGPVDFEQGPETERTKIEENSTKTSANVEEEVECAFEPEVAKPDENQDENVEDVVECGYMHEPGVAIPDENQDENVEENAGNVEGTFDAHEVKADDAKPNADDKMTSADENQAEIADELTEDTSGTVAEEKEDVEEEKDEMGKEENINAEEEVIEEQIPIQKPNHAKAEYETQDAEKYEDTNIEPEELIQEIEEKKSVAETETVAETQMGNQESEERVESQADEDEQVQNAVEYEKPASIVVLETYKSTSFLVLSPTRPSVPFGDTSSSMTESDDAPSSPGLRETSENALKMNGTSDIRENGAEEDDTVRDPNIFRETREKEEVRFAEMNNVRQKFETGNARSEEPTPRSSISVRDEYDQGGEFENEPVRNPDVIRECDHAAEELPEVGSAKNLVNRFKSIQEEQAKPVSSGKRISPPRTDEKVEYESQPTAHMEQYQGQSEAGEFESQPKEIGEVVRSGDVTEDFQPEKGYAKNIMNKFKEIQSETSQHKSPNKREITPDRSGKVEYVSEPRGQKIVNEEARTDSGVFENVPKAEEDVVRSGDKVEEPLPEQGMAQNLVSKFKQMEASSGYKAPSSPKREITPDRSGKVEYVSEPKGFLEKYEPPVESGEFENKPVSRPEVVRSGEATEEVLPEVGSAKKAMERFKEIQKQSTSPVSSKSKEITPPRETSPGKTVAGVVENTPQSRPDVVRSGDAIQEELPAQGTARNILNKFKDIQASESKSTSPGRKPKEFTPPPESGVYENTPKKHLDVEVRQSESGVIENTPARSAADVARERESASPESELPEQGLAKNLVSKWKQLESSASAKSPTTASPKFKEFTPPRDTRGPLSPKSPSGVASNGVHPSQLPGQYQPIEAPGLYENDPERKADVYRESDTDWEAGMPAKNTTASMLEKFKTIQQKASEDVKSPTTPTKKESTHIQEEFEDKTMFRVAQTEKCSACEKTVYAMEKLEMNGLVYHKNCFKCSHCSSRLTPKTFSMNEGVIYCVNHFKQLFARKGNYDEGFGRQQYKKVWEEKKKEDASA